MSNRIELKLNDKLVLREQDEKGKFMIVKQGIKGNKNINENAYRLVYRLIRDFLSGKAFNSKVIYNTETKKLEYDTKQRNIETQQRNIQIDIQSNAESDELKYYTQITGNYSKPNLAILTLDPDGKLVVNIYIPETINNLIDKESIYYAKLINEIQKIKEPSLQNLFQNVEKRYTFSDSEKEPAYSVFEKLNDLTNKLENKHFKQLTVEYFDKENKNEFEYSMNKKPKGEDHNLKYLPFTMYLENFIPTFNKEQIEETSLGFLLDLAIKRYKEVHDEFTPREEAPAAAAQTSPAASQAAAPRAPTSEASPAPEPSLETLEGIKNKIECYLDGLTSDLPTVNVNSTKQFLKNQLKINFEQFKESFDGVQIPNISQPSKEHITKLIIKYETLAEQELIKNLEGAVLTIKEKAVLNPSELTIKLDDNYTITKEARNVIDKDKITQISVIKPTKGTEPHTMYIVLNNNNISVIEVQGKIQEGDAQKSEIKLTLSNPKKKKMAENFSNSTSTDDLNALKTELIKTELITVITQIPKGEQIPELTNLKNELGGNTYTLKALQSIKQKLDNYSKLRERAEKIAKLINNQSNGENSSTINTPTIGDKLAELSTNLLGFNILPHSSQSTISTTAEDAKNIHSKILNVMEQLETNPTQSVELKGLSEELKGLSEELKGLSEEAGKEAGEAEKAEETTVQQKNTKDALMKFIENLQSLIQMYKEIIKTKQSPQAGGKLTKQLDELNYKLHITMYIQKLIRLMVYLYVLKKDDNLSLETFGIELVLNIVIFLAINDSSSEYMICYMIDTVVSMLSVYVYLHVCKKEKYTVNKNVVLGLVLSPYYLLCM
jgi:hypothetical protein